MALVSGGLAQQLELLPATEANYLLSHSNTPALRWLAENQGQGGVRFVGRLGGWCVAAVFLGALCEQVGVRGHGLGKSCLRDAWQTKKSRTVLWVRK